IIGSHWPRYGARGPSSYHEARSRTMRTFVSFLESALGGTRFPAGQVHTSGVSFAALHDYGLGRRKPCFAAVVKITRVLDVTCEAFADCEDVAPPGDDQATGEQTSRRRRSRK